MNIRRTFKSSVNSILWCFLLIIVYLVFELNFSLLLQKPLGAILTLLIASLYFFVISFIGWLIIGFPWHWFLSKYTSGSYFLYAFPALMTILVELVFRKFESALFFGSFALIQALIFRYYVFKKI